MYSGMHVIDFNSILILLVVYYFFKHAMLLYLVVHLGMDRFRNHIRQIFISNPVRELNLISPCVKDKVGVGGANGVPLMFTLHVHYLGYHRLIT